MDAETHPPEKSQLPVSESERTAAETAVGDIISPARSRWQHLKHYFTSWEGWVGDYVCELTGRITALKLMRFGPGLHVLDHPESLAAE